jgi:hypothetical protein
LEHRFNMRKFSLLVVKRLFPKSWWFDNGDLRRLGSLLPHDSPIRNVGTEHVLVGMIDFTVVLLYKWLLLLVLVCVSINYHLTKPGSLFGSITV